MALVDKIQIKQLIQDSTLLSEQERAEWLEFLPLMNDRQLLDLSNILSGSGKEVIESKSASSASEQSEKISQSIVTNKQPKIISSLGPLDVQHTLNDPRVETKTESMITRGMTVSPNFPAIPVKKTPANETPFIISPQKEGTFSEAKSSSSKIVFADKDVEGFVFPSTVNTLMSLSMARLSEVQYKKLILALKQLGKSWGFENLLILLRRTPLYKDYIDSTVAILNNKPSKYTLDELALVMDMMLQLRSG